MKCPKTLNKTATVIFLEIIQQIPHGHCHHKLDNAPGAFMPLSIEILWEGKGMRYVSLAHYGLQNGDLMSDPEMTFLWLQHPRQPNIHNIIPLTYTNHYAGVYTEAVEFDIQDGMTAFYPGIQNDIKNFANLWMGNIHYQQLR